MNRRGKEEEKRRILFSFYFKNCQELRSKQIFEWKEQEGRLMEEILPLFLPHNLSLSLYSPSISHVFSITKGREKEREKVLESLTQQEHLSFLESSSSLITLSLIQSLFVLKIYVSKTNAL